jgi:hypothetical protein
MSEKDWREWAYLQQSNWPEAIPNCGPKREYGPCPWGDPPTEIDTYAPSHPDACSIGDSYTGHTCPWCGVPIDARNDEVRTADGEIGTVWDIEARRDDFVMTAYHKTCWYKRAHRQNSTLDLWSVEA